MRAANLLSASVGKAAACRALGLPRASFYRYQHPRQGAKTVATRSKSGRALSDTERQEVLGME